MLSATLQLLESGLISLPKDLADSEPLHFLRDLYGDFQRATAGLGDAVGEEIRAKRAATSTLCDSILAAVAAIGKQGMDTAVALIGPGLEAVRADLLAVASKNEDTVLRGQSLYR